MQTVPIACWQKACLSLAVQKVDSLGPCIADIVAWNSVELYVYSSNGKPIAYKEAQPQDHIRQGNIGVIYLNNTNTTPLVLDSLFAVQNL